MQASALSSLMAAGRVGAGTGTAAGWFAVVAIGVLAVLLLAGYVALVSARAEMGIVALLLVLSLGTETLDLMPVLKAFTPLAAIVQIVPSASITPYDLLAGLLLAALLFRSVTVRRRAALPPQSRYIVHALLLYLSVAFVTTVVASFTVPFSRLNWSLLYLLRLAFTIAPFAAVMLIGPSEEWSRRYLALYMFLALVPILRTVIQLCSAGGSAWQRGLERPGGFSAMGLGTYLCSVAGMSLAMIALNRRRWSGRTALAWAGLLGSMGIIVVVQKRASIVGLLAVIVLCVPLLLWRNSIKRTWGYATALLALFAGAVVARGSTLEQTIRESRKDLLYQGRVLAHAMEVDPGGSFYGLVKALADRHVDQNIIGRLVQWYLALQAAIRYPQGVGFRGMVLSPYSYPHNQYLQVLAESSLAGLLSFLLMIIVVLRAALKGLRSASTTAILASSGVLCGFVSMLTQGMFEESFHNWDGMALLWLLTGLMAIETSRGTADSDADGRNGTTTRAH